MLNCVLNKFTKNLWLIEVYIFFVVALNYTKASISLYIFIYPYYNQIY